MAKKKRLAWLTAEEDKVRVEAYEFHGGSPRHSDALAWRDVQQQFPRLLQYDGCHSSCRIVVAKELGSSKELASQIVKGYPFAAEMVVSDDLDMDSLRKAVDAPDLGDTLFKFIVVEICEGAVDKRCRITADGIQRVLDRAQRDIGTVQTFVEHLRLLRQAGKKKKNA
jgi:hypothetical protein